MADMTPDQETILRIVRTWPRAQQVRLARMILGDLGDTDQDDTIDPATRRPHLSSEYLRGILATPGKPPPTDEDIERIRMEKYGY